MPNRLNPSDCQSSTETKEYSSEPSDLTDVNDLIRAAQQGCTDSFARLVQVYSPRLFRFLFQRTGSRQDAEDLVQETFLRVFRHLDQFDTEQSFSTWVFTIAWRLAANHYRKNNHTPSAALPEDFCDPSQTEQATGQQEQRDSLWAAVRQLPPAQRQAMELRYLGDLSMRQIAEVMGLHGIYVKVLLFRARKKLVRQLAESPGNCADIADVRPVVEFQKAKTQECTQRL
ncbi:MAG: RNA polymerase sigma factor [Anaerohalosphaeraceae bacterium]